MIEVRATPNVEELSRALSGLSQKQLPFALALASTRMAQRIQRVVKNRLRQSFDNPTNTTLNSLFVKQAKKQNPTAKTYFKDAWTSGIPADAYLQAQVFGGTRKRKRLDKALIARGLMNSNQFAVPRPSVLDSNGNVKGGTVMKILSGLGAAETTEGSTHNASNSRRSKRKNNRRFFVATIGKATGVWERMATSFGGGSGVKLWFLFVDKEPAYKPRLPFFEIAQEQVEQHYMSEFTSALDKAIASARS